jgi:hypothetical protein
MRPRCFILAVTSLAPGSAAALASPLPSEKDRVDVARQHLRKLKAR